MKIRSLMQEDYGNITLLVEMTLEEYNDALELQKHHMLDEAFNEGFRAGNYYPSDEELEDQKKIWGQTWSDDSDADVDADRTKDDSQKDHP